MSHRPEPTLQRQEPKATGNKASEMDSPGELALTKEYSLPPRAGSAKCLSGI